MNEHKLNRRPYTPSDRQTHLLSPKTVSQCFSVMFLMSCTSSRTICLHLLLRKWLWSFISSLYDVTHTWKLLASPHHCGKIHTCLQITINPLKASGSIKAIKKKNNSKRPTALNDLRALLLPKYRRIFRPGHQRLNSTSQLSNLHVLTTMRWGPQMPRNKNIQSLRI